MARTILAVIAGYLAIFGIVFFGLTAAWLALGADQAFKPGTWETSLRWNLVGLVVGVAAALAGGWVCAAITKSKNAQLALAIAILVLGAAEAIRVARSGPPSSDPRPPGVSMFETMGKARMPLWNALLQPLIGAAGVLAGARMRRRA